MVFPKRCYVSISYVTICLLGEIYLEKPLMWANCTVILSTTPSVHHLSFNFNLIRKLTPDLLIIRNLLLLIYRLLYINIWNSYVMYFYCPHNISIFFLHLVKQLNFVELCYSY